MKKETAEEVETDLKAEETTEELIITTTETSLTESKREFEVDMTHEGVEEISLEDLAPELEAHRPNSEQVEEIKETIIIETEKEFRADHIIEKVEEVGTEIFAEVLTETPEEADVQTFRETILVDKEQPFETEEAETVSEESSIEILIERPEHLIPQEKEVETTLETVTERKLVYEVEETEEVVEETQTEKFMSEAEILPEEHVIDISKLEIEIDIGKPSEVVQEEVTMEEQRTVDLSFEFDMKKPTEETIEEVREAIVFQPSKPSEAEETEEFIETLDTEVISEAVEVTKPSEETFGTTMEQEIELEAAQPAQEFTEEVRETVTVEGKKPTEVETGTTEEEISFELQVGIEAAQPEERVVETVQEIPFIEEGVLSEAKIEAGEAEETLLSESEVSKPSEEVIEEVREIVTVEKEVPSVIEMVHEGEAEAPEEFQAEFEVEYLKEELTELVKDVPVVDEEKTSGIDLLDEAFEEDFVEMPEYEAGQPDMEVIQKSEEFITIEEETFEVEVIEEETHPQITEGIIPTDTEQVSEQPSEEEVDFVIVQKEELTETEVEIIPEDLKPTDISEELQQQELTAEVIEETRDEITISDNIITETVVEEATLETTEEDLPTKVDLLGPEEIVSEKVSETVVVDDRKPSEVEFVETETESLEYIPVDVTATPLEIQTEDVTKHAEFVEVEVKEEELKKPEFLTALKDITVTEGDHVTLEVSFIAFPAPSVTWLLDDEPIESSEDFQVTVDQNFSKLVIPEILTDDEGTLKVLLENKAGSCESSAFIQVKVPDTQKEVETVSQDIEVSEMLITEQEIVEETTKVEVEIKLKPTEGPEEEVSVEVQPEEVETPAAPAEDTGAPEAPRFTQTLQRQLDVYEGTSVTLVCVVIGHPRPTVTWYQEEIELVPGDRFVTEYHEDGRCVLTIKDITFDDEAEYTCQAKNEAGVSTTFVDIFVEKFLNAEEKVIREEFYEVEVEIEIHWCKKDSQGGLESSSKAYDDLGHKDANNMP
ncbi:titin-like isoform X2 [Pomacea canaliculata]|uniref:titin-like isoform X2 n=1 Tax=Pomacea canaliculata TaxID=400727 RepID=UPI000D72C86C|nr:titin-like isoform X2 [Pomacea canaliculata]